MSGRKAHIILCGALLVEVVALYWRMAGGYFVGEDYNYLMYLRLEPPLRSLYRPFYVDYFSGMWFRPLVMTQYFLSWALSGFSVWGHYAVNWLIFWCGAVLIARLARQLGATVRSSYIAAFLFILHPIATGTSGYLAARGDVLGATCAIAALSLHIGAIHGGRGLPVRLGALAAAMGAYLSKEMFISLPLLILMAPLDNAPEKRAARWMKHIGAALPYVCAAAVFILWRRAVIGDALGGYLYKRSDPGAIILSTPFHILRTLFIFPRMFLDYGSFLLTSPATRLIVSWASLAGMAFVVGGGLRKIKSHQSYLALGWIFIAALPVANFPDQLASSPRLVYFPLAFFAVWLAVMMGGAGMSKVAALIILSIAWLPLNGALSHNLLQKADRFRRVCEASMKFFLPKLEGGPHNQTLVAFGLPPDIYSPDLLFKAHLPPELDLRNHPAFTSRLLPGGRGTYIGVIRRPETPVPEKKFIDLADYRSRDHILIYLSDILLSEHVKPPDIPELIRLGKPVTVGEYDPASGSYRDVTDMFRRSSNARVMAAGYREKRPSWNFSHGLGDWKPNNQLVLLGDKGAARMRSTGNDPFITVGGLDLAPSLVKSFKIEMRLERKDMFTPKVFDAFLHWESEREPPFGLKPYMRFAVEADGQWRTYTAPVGPRPSWRLSGHILSLRLDPASSPMVIELKSIEAIPYTTEELAP